MSNIEFKKMIQVECKPLDIWGMHSLLPHSGLSDDFTSALNFIDRDIKTFFLNEGFIYNYSYGYYINGSLINSDPSKWKIVGVS